MHIVLGRIFGEVMAQVLPEENPQDLLFVDPGMFALIGAVAFLGYCLFVVVIIVLLNMLF